MNFQEQLKAQLAGLNTNNFDDEETRPESTLRHPKLKFDANLSSVMVRILPPATPDASFAEGFRSIFLNATTDKGKAISAPFTLGLAPDVNSPLEHALGVWKQEKRVPNRFSNTQSPSVKFIVNAVQVSIDPATGRFTYELDSQGQLMVRVLELPQSAYTAIATKLQDVSFGIPQPQTATPEQAQYGFISETNAYALRITKPEKNSSTRTYQVDVMQSVQLQALPQGWQNLAEDLRYQAQPSEVHSADFVKNFIEWADRGSASIPQGQFSQPQFGQPQQGFSQPQFTQQAPMTNQAPVQQGFSQPPVQQGFAQPQQGFAQPQQGFNQPQQGFAQPQHPAEQQAYTPQGQVQNVAPVTPPAPVAPVQTQQPVTATQPQMTPQPTIESAPAQGTEHVPNAPTELPDIQALINQMQQQ